MNSKKNGVHEKQGTQKMESTENGFLEKWGREKLGPRRTGSTKNGCDKQLCRLVLSDHVVQVETIHEASLTPEDYATVTASLAGSEDQPIEDEPPAKKPKIKRGKSSVDLLKERANLDPTSTDNGNVAPLENVADTNEVINQDIVCLEHFEGKLKAIKTQYDGMIKQLSTVVLVEEKLKAA